MPKFLRAILALALALAGAAAWGRVRKPVMNAWQEWRYPAGKDSAQTPLGKEILSARRRELKTQAEQEISRVSAKLERAQSQGLAVGALKEDLIQVRSLVSGGLVKEGMTLLNLVDIRVPDRRAASPYTPAKALLMEIDQPSKPRARPASRKKR